MTIVVATLFCDRKHRSEMVALPHMLKLRGDCAFYANYETDPLNADDSDWTGGWSKSGAALIASGRPFAFDFWTRYSNWHARDDRDQDQSRLEGICIARNMARTYALSVNASHLMFVDADVIVQPDGLERLLALNHPLCGGYVPGRGAHASAHYVFGERWRRGDLIGCAHGTLGYSLIARELFEVISFRYGPHPTVRTTRLSEDPCFAADAERFGVQEWLIDTTITAEHWDDPERPLTLAEATNGGHA